MRPRREASVNSERAWREQFNELVSSDDLRLLSEQSLADSVAAIGSLWVEVIVLLAAANLLPHLPLGWAVAGGILIVVLMGLRMNAFGVILHEGSHGLLVKSRSRNDQLCNWGVAFWTVNSVEEYRPTHRLHHRYLGQENDPDRGFYLVPARRGALTFLILQDLVGVTAFRRATTRLSGTSQESGAPASLLARPQLLIGKLAHPADCPRSVRRLPGDPSGDRLLCRLLARTDRVHVSDDPPPQDHHRAFRPRIA